MIVVLTMFEKNPILALENAVILGHVNEYPRVHDFGIPRHTQSMIAYMILTEYF